MTQSFESRDADKIVMDTYSAEVADTFINKLKASDGMDVFQCSICLLQTNYTQSIRRHLATMHTAPSQYFCPNCNKEFTKKVYFNKHTRSCAWTAFMS